LYRNARLNVGHRATTFIARLNVGHRATTYFRTQTRDWQDLFSPAFCVPLFAAPAVLADEFSVPQKHAKHALDLEGGLGELVPPKPRSKHQRIIPLPCVPANGVPNQSDPDTGQVNIDCVYPEVFQLIRRIIERNPK
jgi:hypothetical protein